MGRRCLVAVAVLFAAAGIGLGAWAVLAPRDHEATATATLPGVVRRADARRAAASPAVARRGLSLTAARGYVLTLHYRSDASAARTRQIAVGATRRVASEALAFAVTRADREVVDARTRGDENAALGAERTAQKARRASEAPFDVRVETAPVDESRRLEVEAAAAGALVLATIVMLAMIGALLVSRRRSNVVPTPPAAEGDLERLDLDEIRRRLAALGRQASVAKTTRLST